jgi:hypothetical protein
MASYKRIQSTSNSSLKTAKAKAVAAAKKAAALAK